MGLSIARQLLGQRGPVHPFVVQEPVDAKGAEHHADEAHELETD